jgi:deoxyadenosine/deoxycytidine kinase
VGKTTLTKILSDRFGWKAYFEKVRENPYLPRFYQDMHRWSFHSQIFFLTERFKAHQHIHQMDVPVIQDRSIYEDAEVFAQSLYDQGYMSEEDYATYRELYETVIKTLRSPDLTLYLRASPWTLLSRIRKRWREIERNIDREYLFQLNLAYEKWIRRWQEVHPVKIVETDGRDFLVEKQWTEKLLDEIYQVYEDKVRRAEK